MPRKPSLDRAYFDRIYRNDADPWQFATSPYESEKYDATIGLLSESRYQAGFEIGCSIGVLTKRLAALCDSLLAVDINERALAAARTRCAAESHVEFELMTVPGDFPERRFDLIVLSEVAYYWSDADLALAMDRIAGAAPGGTLELVHFLPQVDDYVRDGDAVHEAFLADSRFVRQRHVRAENYRIDVLHVA
jgi:SAM-dependent methyltransferase